MVMRQITHGTWAPLLLTLWVGVGQAKFSREFVQSLNCGPTQQSKLGDKLSIKVSNLLPNSFDVEETSRETLTLGKMGPRLDTGLGSLCAGEVVILRSDEENDQDILVEVEIIMRTLAKENKCNNGPNIEPGDKVTMKTRTRIPNVIYLVYPHPTGNTPISVKQRGTPGTTIDLSVDSVKTGEGLLVPGWEKGIMGACVGEERKIMMSSEMAFGASGIHQKIPPNVPLALDVKIMKIEKEPKPERKEKAVIEEDDVVLKYLEQGANGELFSFAP